MPPDELALTSTPDPRIPPVVEGTDDVIVVEDDDVASPAQPDPVVEAEASRLGWVPKDKFKGNPQYWIDAATFVERGQQVLPLLQAQMARERETNAELRERIAQLENASTEFAKFRDTQAAGARTAEETTLRAQRRKALEDGDYDTVSTIDERLIDIKVEARTQKATPAAPTGEVAANQRVLMDYVKDNVWMNDDVLGPAMAIEVKNLVSSGVRLKGRDLLDAAADRVKRFYPEKFGSRRSTPNMVEDGSTGSVRVNGKRSYDRLRPDFKAACDKTVAAKELTREQYLAECGPEAFA